MQIGTYSEPDRMYLRRLATRPARERESLWTRFRRFFDGLDRETGFEPVTEEWIRRIDRPVPVRPCCP